MWALHGTRGLARATFILALGCAACGGGSAASDAGGPGLPDSSGLTWTLAIEDLDEALLSVWAGSADEVMVVGGVPDRALVLELDRGDLTTYDDDRWREVDLPTGTPLAWWVWGQPGGVRYVVGEGATILRRDEVAWIPQPVSDLVPPQTTFYGVWGAAEDDVWVVGGNLGGGAEPGVILHWDGLTWARTNEPETRGAPLFKVWGTGPSDVFAVGEDGTIVHFDGTSWSLQPSGLNERLVAVWGRGPTDVFVVGGAVGGKLLHWDGAAWTSLFDGPEPLAGIAVVEHGGLVAAGSRGYVAAFGPATDGNFFQGGRSIAPSVDFHAAAAVPGLTVLVGADLLSNGRPTWMGTVAMIRTSLPARIDRVPDAAPVDAPLFDAAARDAAPPDASSLPGPGEICALPPIFPNCRPGLECWVIAETGAPICTTPCTSVTECGAFAPACCERPGFQTLTTVCMAESSGGCGSVSP